MTVADGSVSHTAIIQHWDCTVLDKKRKGATDMRVYAHTLNMR